MEKPEWGTLYKGNLLFRAVENSGDLLTPKYDEDTGKTGCYFSCGHPCLSDSMTLEYDKPLVRGKYLLKDDVKVVRGKYAYRDLPEHHQNVNHYDDDIGALTLDIFDVFKYAEVFLVPSEFDKLELLDVVKITPEQVREEYKDYINKYFR